MGSEGEGAEVELERGPREQIRQRKRREPQIKEARRGQMSRADTSCNHNCGSYAWKKLVCCTLITSSHSQIPSLCLWEKRNYEKMVKKKEMMWIITIPCTQTQTSL